MKVSVTRWANDHSITHKHAVLINDKLLAVSHTLTNQALAECLRAELLTEEVENHFAPVLDGRSREGAI